MCYLYCILLTQGLREQLNREFLLAHGFRVWLHALGQNAVAAGMCGESSPEWGVDWGPGTTFYSMHTSSRHAPPPAVPQTPPAKEMVEDTPLPIMPMASILWRVQVRYFEECPQTWLHFFFLEFFVYGFRSRMSENIISWMWDITMSFGCVDLDSRLRWYLLDFFYEVNYFSTCN